MTLAMTIMVFNGCGASTIEETASESSPPKIDYESLSFEELLRLSDEGDTNASFMVALTYDYGLNEQTKDFEKAADYYHLCDEAGDERGSLGLGYLHLNDMLENASREEASRLFQKAVDAGLAEGYVGLGRVALLEMPQKAAAAADAYRCFLKVKDDETCPDGLFYWGYCQEKGIGTSVDYERAKEAYETVSSFKSEAYKDAYAIDEATIRLALMYLEGLGVDTDVGDAISYLEDAADRGSPKAAFYLGRIYESGMDGEPDYEKALMWYQKATESEYAPALNQLGLMYAKGYGVEVDYGQTFYFHRMAALQGYVPAQVNLGYLYENGLGVEKDLTVAKTYYRMANESGHEGADVALDRIEYQLLQSTEEENDNP